jgi:hypothetical protein
MTTLVELLPSPQADRSCPLHLGSTPPSSPNGLPPLLPISAPLPLVNVGPPLAPTVLPDTAPEPKPLTASVLPAPCVPELLPLPLTPLARPPQAANAKSTNATGDRERWFRKCGLNTSRGLSHRSGRLARDYLTASDGRRRASPRSHCRSKVKCVTLRNNDPLPRIASIEVIGSSGEKLGVDGH